MKKIIYCMVAAAIYAAAAGQPMKEEPIANELVITEAVIEEPINEETEEKVIVTPAAQMAAGEAPNYTEEELEILALIIFQEAGGNSYEDSTRQMVGEVFLNRVASDLYPDTFEEVATQKAQYGRLYWKGLKWPDRASDPYEAKAVKRAYEMAEALLTGKVERILPEDAVYQAEFPQGKEVLKHQDGTYFCR
jgi:hypothetical protein